MRALELELSGKRNRGGIAVYVLAAALMAVVLDQALRYREAEPARPAAPVVREAAPVNPEAYKAAEETVRRLAAPWDRLFHALEAAQTRDIGLVSLEPDPESRTLLIAGEAKDYLAALTYLARLSDQPGLSRLHLVRHEARRGAQPAMLFTISARWEEIREGAQPATQPAGLETFYAEMQRAETTDALLAKLYAAALASGVELRAAQYRLADSRHRIERYEIVLPVSGSYTQVRRFLHSALVEIPVLSLDRANFRRKAVTEGRIDADVVLTLHLVRA